MHEKEPSSLLSDNCIQVVVGVIHNKLMCEILLAKRPEDKHMGGLWEFPGGKIEQDETVEQALIRELQEELNITPTAFKPVINFKYVYPEKTILFHVLDVLAFSGKPEGRENQKIKWVKTSDLYDYEFPPANTPIISAILLPDRYAITGNFTHYNELTEKVHVLMQNGIRLICFRANHLEDAQYGQYAKKLTSFCQSFPSVKLLIKDHILFLEEPWCHGVHLRTKTALKLYQQGWKYQSQGKKNHPWLVMSCHNAQEIAIAKAIGVHFVTLSPVCKTVSHPKALPIGFKQAAEITKNAGFPVYWLGGLSLKEMKQVHAGSAQGIAAVSAFWSH